MQHNKKHVNTLDNLHVPHVFTCLHSHFCKFNKVECCVANLLTENGSAAAANHSVTCHGDAEQLNTGSIYCLLLICLKN